MEEGEIPKECPLLICFFSEIFASIILMYIGCMGCVDSFQLGPLIPAFTFGFAILASIQFTDHISPTHMNPGVSLAFLIIGKMHWKKFLVYIVAQYIGCSIGYGLLRLTVTNKEGLCHLKVIEPLNVLQAFGTEIICSFTLMVIVFGATDPRNASRTDSIPLRIAFESLLGPSGSQLSLYYFPNMMLSCFLILSVLTIPQDLSIFCYLNTHRITGIILAAGPYTGAGLNAARSFPSAIFDMDFKDHWVYELGPTIGQCLAAVLYRFVFSTVEKHSLYNFLSRERD